MAEANATANDTRKIWAMEGYTLLVFEVLIIFLNILAVTVILRFKKKLNPDILIFSLAVADLTKACIPLNMTLVAYLGGKQMRSESPLCAIFGWTAFTLNSGIMLVMTIMAIDRYVAICWPFEYKHFLSKKRLIYTIIGIFVFSGCHSMLPLVGVGQMRSFHHGSFCHFDFDSTVAMNMGYSVFVLVLGISMLLVVVFCYSRAMCSVRGLIRRQARRMSTSSRELSKGEQKTQSMNHMFARLMFVMMVVFCISWLLFLVVVLQHVSGWYSIPPEAHFWSMRLAVANSILNPIIGAVMCKPYRRGYLFIICKVLHCFGVCSFYEAKDPWSRSRRLSASSRHSSSNEHCGPNTTEKGAHIGPSSISNFDSGIVSESNEYHGLRFSSPIGVSNASFQMTIEEWEEDTTKARPKLTKKRISFKDEIEASDIWAGFDSEPVKHSGNGTPMDHHGNQFLSENVIDSPSLKEDEDGSQENVVPPEYVYGTNSLMFARSADIIKKYSFGGRKRKYSYQGFGVSPFTSLDPVTQVSSPLCSQSELEDAPFDANVIGISEGRPPNNAESLGHQAIWTSQHPLAYHNQLACSELEQSEPFPVELSKQDSRKSETSRSLCEQGPGTFHPTATSENPELDEQSEIFPVELSKQDSRKSGKSKSLCEQGNGNFDFKADSENHDCGMIRRKSAPSAIEITHFPVDTNCMQTSTTVTMQNDKSSRVTNTSFTVETPPRRSRDYKSVQIDIVCQERNMDIPVHVSSMNDPSGRKFSDHPVTPKRAHGHGPMFNINTCKSVETLASDSLIISGYSPHPYDTSSGLDLPPFRRHSCSSARDFLQLISSWRLSEPDLTRSLAETKLVMPDMTSQSTKPTEENHDWQSRFGRRESENGVISHPRRARSPGRQRTSSKIYRELSERSQRELEREVFC